MALRKTVGADAIVTRAPGYMLEVDPDSVDLHRFESLAAEGADALASGDATRAAELLGRALELWRGEPLADLDSVESVQLERVRLDELRLGALADRVDADLTLGRHAELVGELRSLVREHAFQERFRGQLMLALYRSGRQAEALDVYRQGRSLLAAELGLEPGEPLKELERAILRHDDALAPPSEAVRHRARTQRRPRPWQRRSPAPARRARRRGASPRWPRQRSFCCVQRRPRPPSCRTPSPSSTRALTGWSATSRSTAPRSRSPPARGPRRALAHDPER